MLYDAVIRILEERMLGVQPLSNGEPAVQDATKISLKASCPASASLLPANKTPAPPEIVCYIV